MNDYVILDGKRYRMRHQDWIPTPKKPATVRPLLSGNMDATFGPTAIREWKGRIRAPVTPESVDFGSIDDLRATLDKRTPLSFTDHYDNSYTVVALGPYDEESMSPKWDSPSNRFHVSVRLIVTG